MFAGTLNNLQLRFIVGGLAAALTILAIVLSHTPLFSLFFILLTAAIICLALWEYYRIAKAKGFQPLTKLGAASTVVYSLAVYLDTQMNGAHLLPVITIVATLISAFLYYFFKGSDPVANLAATFFGIIYLTIPLGCIFYVNYFYAPPFVTDGRWCLFYLMVVTKITDTGALLIGKKYGQRKLCPAISPQKTWEGALGGLSSALAASILIYIALHLFFETPPFNLTFFQSVWLALLISITAQFGDLAESLLKRDIGVKDSSNRLPGMGGILDLVDSMVFTTPLMYIFLVANSPGVL